MDFVRSTEYESTTTMRTRIPGGRPQTGTMPTKQKDFSKQNDKKDQFKYMNQPRLRKITTVSNSLGLVVQSTDVFFTVWVLNNSNFVTIGHSDCTVKFNLGSWINIGLFPTGELASFSMEPFIVTPYQTKIVDGRILVFATADESFFKQQSIGQFGKVGLHSSLQNLQTKKNREPFGVWIKWLTTKEAKESVDKSQWMIVELDQSNTLDVEDFADHEYRKCYEFVRRRIERSSKCGHLHTGSFPYKSTIRHFGLVTDKTDQQNCFPIWSPGICPEFDHTAKFKPENDTSFFVEQPPACGQWIQFDTRPQDAEQYAKPNGGFRFNITEYMPITTPKGITVFQTGRSLRVILSCVLVRSTELSLIYELPDFGLVLDRKSNLRSGAFMQLVLERISHRNRKQSNVNWKVVGSTFIEMANMANIEKTQSLITQIVPHNEAYECATPVLDRAPERLPYNRIQFAPSYGPPKNVRRDGYHEPVYDSKKKFNAVVQKFDCLVEKVDLSQKTAILWSFSTSSSYHVSYEEIMNILIGEMIHVVLYQKPDGDAPRGFRWVIDQFEKREPIYQCSIINNRVSIYEDMVFNGEVDSLNRPVLKGKHFPKVIDEHHFIHSKIFKNFPNQKIVSVNIKALVTRKKIQNATYDTSKVNCPPEVYNWILTDNDSFVWQTYPYCFSHNFPPAMMLPPSHPNDTMKTMMIDENKNGPKA